MSTPAQAFAFQSLLGDEYQLPTEERLELTMRQPTHPAAMAVPAANKITKARIQYALANMSHELYPEVLTWIRQVAQDSPARATELYLELVQFSVPKLKAIAMTVDDNSKPARELSLSDLQSIVAEQ